MTLISGFKIQIGHFFRKPCQFTDRSGDPVSDQQYQQTADQNDGYSYKQIKVVGYGCALLNTLQRRADQIVVSIFILSPAFYILHTCKTVMYLPNDTIFRLFQNMTMLHILIQIINVSKKFATEHFSHIGFPPVIITAVLLIYNDPGQIISGTAVFDFIRHLFLCFRRILYFSILICIIFQKVIQIHLRKNCPGFLQHFHFF